MTESSNRERILAASKSLFFHYGYNKVTMDEVAAELGMSKKTIYQHFSGKRDLFRKALLNQVQLISDGLQEIVENDSLSFESKLRKMLLSTGKNFPRPSPVFFRDLQHDVREVWEEVDQARLRSLHLYFSKLFQEGLEKGYVREETDLHLLIVMLGASVQKLIDPKFLSGFPMTAGDVFEKIVDTLSLGVLSEKGRENYQRICHGDMELES